MHLKPEVKDLAVQAAVSAPTTGWAWLTGLTVAEIVAVVLGVVQLVYLLRKWWREETEWGIRLRRWARRVRISKHGDLDDDTA